MVKRCPDHGPFETLLWRGEPSMESWKRSKETVHPSVCYSKIEHGCPFDCGICPEHRQLPCSVLLEITHRCNLRCPVCFADSGRQNGEDPDLEEIEFWYKQVLAVAGPCSIQLSGGEPTLRDDLPAIVAMGRRLGFSFIQVNTNGVRLASESNYAQILKDTGLATVFLQFDSVDDTGYRTLRGRPLLEEKLLAIEHCGKAGLAVILVPTLVPGINTQAIGAIMKLALEFKPVVRGIHFQPISYFGRYPTEVFDRHRITLPEVMRALEEQTEGAVKVFDFAPPGCEHALCSFHGSFVRLAKGKLRPITGKADYSCCTPRNAEGARRTIELVSRQWSFPGAQKTEQVSYQGTTMPSGDCQCDHPMSEKPVSLDTFLEQARDRSFTISCMAFQDVWNIDLQRLKGCCIFVVSPDGRLVPFCAYNITSATGQTLYRKTGIG